MTSACGRAGANGATALQVSTVAHLALRMVHSSFSTDRAEVWASRPPNARLFFRPEPEAGRRVQLVPRGVLPLVRTSTKLPSATKRRGVRNSCPPSLATLAIRSPTGQFHADFRSMLRLVSAFNKLFDTIETQCDHDCLSVRSHQGPIGLRLLMIKDLRRTVDLRAT
jgi:hypothetical protein